jgi:hypothetical protein
LSREAEELDLHLADARLPAPIAWDALAYVRRDEAADAAALRQQSAGGAEKLADLERDVPERRA